VKTGDLVRAGNPDSSPGIVISVTDNDVLVLWPEEEYGLSREKRDVLQAVSNLEAISETS